MVRLSEIIINRETNARVHLELWIETEPPKSSLCLQVSLIMQKKVTLRAWNALCMPHTTSFSLLVVSLSCCCCWLTLGKPLIGVRYSRAHDDDVRSRALCRWCCCWIEMKSRKNKTQCEWTSEWSWNGNQLKMIVKIVVATHWSACKYFECLTAPMQLSKSWSLRSVVIIVQRWR